MTHPLGRLVLVDVPNASAYGRLARRAKNRVCWDAEYHFMDDPFGPSHNNTFEVYTRWLVNLAKEQLG